MTLVHLSKQLINTSLGRLLLLYLLSVPVAFAVAPIVVEIDVDGSTMGTTSGPLTVSRIELYFNDNAAQVGRISVASHTSNLEVSAHLLYQGNGLLSGRWLVDGRVIGTFSRFLTFGSDITLHSGDSGVYLPTFSSGEHRVSLQLNGQTIDIPQVRYTVVDDVGQGISSGITPLLPGAEQQVDPLQIYFRWLSPADFDYYRFDLVQLSVTQAVTRADSLINSSASSPSSAVSTPPFGSQQLLPMWRRGAQLKTVLSAEVRTTEFIPTLAERLALKAGSYQWKVRGFRTDGSSEASDAMPFTLRAPPAQGNVYFRRVWTAASAVTNDGWEQGNDRLLGSQQLAIKTDVSAANGIYFVAGIENSSFFEQQGLMLELREGTQVLSRQILPKLPGSRINTASDPQSSFVIVSLPWIPPSATESGRLSLVLLSNGVKLDTATIDWSVPLNFAMSQLDFREYVPPALPAVDLPGPGCVVNSEIFSPILLEPNHQFDAASAAARVIAWQPTGKPLQRVARQAYFSADEGQSGRFEGIVSDQGVMSQYLAVCDDWKTQFSNYLRQITRGIDRLVEDSNCSKKVANYAAVGNFPSPPVAFSNQRLQALISNFQRGGFNCSQLNSVRNGLNAIVAEIAGSANATEQSGYPVNFRVYEQAQNGALNLVWQDPQPVYVTTGSEGLAVHSGNWQVAKAGHYLATIQNYEPMAPLYSTLAGGLPPFLEIAGFELEIIEAIASNGTHKGRARARWRGNSNAAPLEFSFSDVTFVPGSDPLHGRVVGGVASLNNSVEMKLGEAGMQFDFVLQKLTLDAYHANATLSLRYFDSATSPSTSTVSFIDVPIMNGGEFIAESRFEQAGTTVLLSDMLAIRPGGSSIIADFSPHLGYDTYHTDPGWQGVGLAGGELRTRVAYRPGPELGLFDTLNSEHSYIYGRYKLLTLLPQGGVRGEIEVAPVGEFAAFFTETATPRLELVQPAGFALEFSGGRLQIDGYGIGGVDLAGYLHLPLRYNAAPIVFNSLRRDVTGTGPNGFVSEEITRQVPVITLDQFSYRPERARLKFKEQAQAFNTQPGAVNAIPAQWPQDSSEIARWFAGLKTDLEIYSARQGGSLLMAGGVLTIPWEEQGTTADKTGSLRQAGGFTLDSSGLRGAWLMLDDPQPKRISGFAGRVDALYLALKESALINSRVEGVLNIPYPAQLDLGFEARLAADGGLLDVTLTPPALADGWLLSYWQMRLFPGYGAPSPKSPLMPFIFDAAGERIVLNRVPMQLEVSNAFGGVEFTRNDGKHPFTLSLDIYPDGNIGHSGDHSQGPQIDPGSAGELKFLGLSFVPDSNQIEVRPYRGDSAQPAADEKPTSSWLVRLEGKLNFNLFGERGVRIQHTAMGARVPFVEPTTADGEPVLADSAGVLTVDARLKFINTYGMDDGVIQNRFPADMVDNNDPFSAERDRGSNLQPEPFKAFLGEGKIEIINALKINGLAEAGQRRGDGQGARSYEKIGVGGGVDVVKAMMAGLHGVETVAQFGGAVVEITTGASGLGAEVIHVASDAVAFANSAVVTAAAIAATGASAGGATGVGVEEIRHLVGTGLELSSSSISLLQRIYMEGNVVSPPPTVTDAPYVGMEIAEIMLGAAGKGVEFENLSDRDVAEIILETLDVTLPLLQSIPITPAADDEKADLALQTAHIMIKAARAMLQGHIDEITAWGLVSQTVAMLDGLSRLQELKTLPGNEFLPLAVALAQTSVGIGQSIGAGNANIDPRALVGLADAILSSVCAHPEMIQPVLATGMVGRRDASNVISIAHTVFAAINKDEYLNASVAAPQLISGVFIPLLDNLINQGPNGLCEGNVNFDPYNAQVKALLGLSRQALTGVDSALRDPANTLAWAMATVVESAKAIESFQENVIDSQVLELLSALGNVSDQLAGSGAPELKLLQTVDTMTPIVRNQVAQLSADGAELVDVVGSLFDVVMLPGGGQQTDPLAWLDSAERIFDEIEDIVPQFASVDQKVLLAAAKTIKYLVEVIKKGVTAGREASKKSGIIVLKTVRKLLKFVRENIAGVMINQPVSVAIAGDLHDLGHLIPANVEAGSVFDVASVLLELLIETSEISGISTATALRLLADVLTLIGGNNDSLAALAAASYTLPSLWSDQPAEQAYDNALRALLDAIERRGVGDAAVNRAVQRARMALTHSNIRQVGTQVTRLSDGSIVSVSQVDVDGVERKLEVQLGGVLLINYPAGHVDHPGGLKELHVLNVDSLSEVQLLDLAALDRSTSNATLQLRRYKDTQGRSIEYDAQLGDAVRIDEPAHGEKLYRLLQVDSPPAKGTSGEEIQGSVLEARWKIGSPERVVSFTAGLGAVHIRYLGVDRKELRQLDEAENFYRSLQDIEPKLNGDILEYHGAVTVAGNPFILDYTQGQGGFMLSQGRNYDLIEESESLDLTRLPQLDIGNGRLLERRVYLRSGESCYYRPGELAICTHAGGSWDLYELDITLPNVQIPDPAARITPGNLLARGTADGDIVDPNDHSFYGSVSGNLQLEGDAQLGINRIVLSDGTVLLEAGNTELQLLGGTDRATLESMASGQLSEQWQDSEGAHTLTRQPLDSGLQADVEEIVTPAGEFLRRVTVGNETIVWTRTAVGRTQVDIQLPGGAHQYYVYDPAEPAIYPARNVVEIVPPLQSDPQYAQKQLYINLAHNSLAQLQAAPSKVNVDKLLQLLTQAQERGWTIDGLEQTLEAALAQVLSLWVDQELAVINDKVLDTNTIASWLSNADADNPLKRLTQHLASAQQLGLLWADRVQTQLALALRQTYLTLKERLDVSSQMPDARALLQLSILAQTGLVDEQALFSANADEIPGRLQICQALEQQGQQIKGLLDNSSQVFVNADVTRVLDLEATAQQLDCEGIDVNLVQLSVDLVERMRSSLLANAAAGDFMDVNIYAQWISRHGSAGRSAVYASFQRAIIDLREPYSDDELARMASYLHRLQRLDAIELPAQPDPALDEMWLETPNDLSELQARIEELIVGWWKDKWRNALQDLPLASAGYTLISQLDKAGDINARLSRDLIDAVVYQGQVEDRFNILYQVQITALLTALRAAGLNSVEVGDVHLIELRKLDQLSAQLARALPGASLPNSDSLLSNELETELNTMPEPPGEAAIAGIWYWPDLVKRLNLSATRETLSNYFEGIRDTAVQQAQTSGQWQLAITTILGIETALQKLGWDARYSVDMGSSSQLLTTLKEAYQQARASLLLSNGGDEQISDFMAVLVTQQQLGMDLFSAGELPEDNFSAALELVGQALSIRSRQNAACVANHRCLGQNLVTALDLLEKAQLLGVSHGEAIMSNLEDVRDDYLLGELSDDGLGLSSTMVLSKMVSGSVDQRNRAAIILDGLVNGLDTQYGSHRSALKRVADKSGALAALVVNYPVPQPDPLVAVQQQAQARLANWAAAQVRQRVTQLDSATQVTDSMLDEVEQFALDNGDAVAMATQQLGIVTVQTIVNSSFQNRYQAVAAALQPIVASVGAEAELAHRMTSHLPDPTIEDESTFRQQWVTELSDYLIGHVQLSEHNGWHYANYRPAAFDVPGMPDPAQLVTLILQTLNPRSAISADDFITPLQNLLGQIGTTNDAIVNIALRAVNAGVNGAVASLSLTLAGQPDWQMVAEDAFASLAGMNDPGDIWLALVGRSAIVGMRLSRGEPMESLVLQPLTLASEFLEFPEIQALIQAQPEAALIMIGLLQALSRDVIRYIDPTGQIKDPLPFAIARAAAGAVFGNVPAEFRDLGTGISDWGLDFVKTNGDVAAGIDANTVLAQLTGADGVSRLTTVFNQHLLANGEQLNIPPQVLMMPFVALLELVNNQVTLQDPLEAPKVMLDVAAGMLNLLIDGVDGLPVQDVALAGLLRQFKDADQIENGIEFVGRVGLGSIAAVEELGGAANNPKTLSRALNTLWWGEEQPPAAGVDSTAGLNSALTGASGDVVEFVMSAPQIAARVISILSDDPALSRTMRLLDGQCVGGDLLPPDQCPGSPTRHSTIPTFLLATLADVRRVVKSDLSFAAHNNDPVWGYLKTVPVLGQGSGGVPDLSGAADMDSWNDMVGSVTNLETHIVNAQKAALASVDLARFTINMINGLPLDSSGLGSSASEIVNQSVFGSQMGGAMFSGVAGGLYREWDAGHDHQNELQYFEMVGQFALPALVRSAAQLSYTAQGQQWLLALRAAGNYPDLDTIASQMHLEIPANNIASAFIGKSDGELLGWLGVQNDSLYAQLQVDASMDFGAIPLGSVALSGFVSDLGGSEPLELVDNLDVGLCGEVTQQLNPLAFLGGGITPKLGGYFFKQDLTAGYGMKLGVEAQLIIPLNPIAGVKIGIDLGGTAQAGVSSGADPFGSGNVNVTLGQCLRPYLGGSFFGYEMAQMDLPVEMQQFGTLGSGDAEFGFKVKFAIAPSYFDGMIKETCPADSLESALVCGALESAKFSGTTLGAWFVVTNKGQYFGLGDFPQNPGDGPVIGYVFDTGLGLYTAGSWAGWGSSPFGVCQENMCAVRDAAGNILPINTNPDGAPNRAPPGL